MRGRTALVLGGGGERVVAWQTGVLAGMADAGPDPRAADVVLGTSVGSWIGAWLTAGSDPRQAADRLAGRALAVDVQRPSGAAELYAGLAAAWVTVPTVAEARRLIGRLAVQQSPGGEGAFVQEVAAGLPGPDWPAALRVVAVDAVAGERVVLGESEGVSLGRGVAASRAVPPPRPPVVVAGRSLVDGGLGSATNADLLLGDVRAGRVQVVVVVSATDPRPGAPALDRLWTAAQDAEVAELRAAGAVVLECRAGHGAQAAMGADPASDAGAPLAVAAGRAEGRVLAARLARVRLPAARRGAAGIGLLLGRH